MQLSEVGGERRVVELAAVEPSVESPERTARRVFGLSEASTKRCAVCVGRPISAS